MRQFLTTVGVKLLVAFVLLFVSRWAIIHSDFYYLFIGNILLLAGLAILVEGLVALFFAMFKQWRKRKTGIISTSRSTFIVIFIADLILRFTGVMQTYPEQADGRYFSQAQQEKLDSWYWTHTPNTVIANPRKEFRFERNVNSLGLSEQNLSKDKGSKFRILAIGDSFTEGVGTSYENSWVKQMEARWKEHNVQTMNAGIGGSDPVYEFALYRDKLTDYQPDLVVITINSSDITDVIGRGGFDRFHEDGTAGKEAPSWEWAYAANHVFRLIMINGFGYSSDLVKDAKSAELEKKSVKIIKEAIHRFKALTEKQGTELLVVIQPCIQDFDGGKHVPFFGQVELVKYMKSSGIQYVDASEEIKKKTATIQEYYYPLDTHFNKKGYALFGEIVYQKIEELGIFE